MGVVYLAKDPRLGRQVAIKVLPEAFTQDPTRLSRFEREARTLAALNNRHIAMIFGLEQAQTPAGPQQLLILEYVPGVSLGQRLSRGPLPIDEAMRLCVQIAEGLEAAHDQGVVHRDLKPDNVRVTPEGLVKVLDFGLATTTREGVLGDTGTTAGVSGLTVQGMVMGTPGYMSPEQARGLATDRRTDIWSFACVLFECLTGAKAFWGDTVTDALAAIIDREPDYNLLPPRTPTRVRELLKRSLVKDPRRRLRDIGDARLELEDVLAMPASGWHRTADQPVSETRPRSVSRLSLPLVSPQGELTLAPSGRSSLSFSGDGVQMVFAAGHPVSQLYVRRLDTHEARPIPGTQNADAPIFSPDAQRAAYFEGGQLKCLSLSGGLGVPLAPAPKHQGASWGDDGLIYFIPEPTKGLYRVSPLGGPPELVAGPDAGLNERAMLAPEVLPGSRHALVTVLPGSGFEDALITAIDLRTGQRRPLVHGGCNPRLAPSGHLVFTRGSTFLAVAFDPERLDIFGQPVVLKQGVLAHAQGGGSQFAFSCDGTLVYAPGGVWQPGADLLVADRDAPWRPFTPERMPLVALASASMGSRLVTQVSSAGRGPSMYLSDLSNQTAAPIPLATPGDASCPVLSSDGTLLAFVANHNGQPHAHVLRLDVPGSSAQVVLPPPGMVPASVTPRAFCDRAGGTSLGVGVGFGGRALALTAADAGGQQSVLIAPADDPRSPRVLGVLEGVSASGVIDISPDARLAAFTMDVAGKPGVFVQPVGPGGQALRKQPSAETAWCPTWTGTGGELVFCTETGPVAVRVAIEPALMLGRPRPLAQSPAILPTSLARTFAISRDAQLFVAIRPCDDAPSVQSLCVVVNWFDDLRQRCPTPERTPSPQSAAPTQRPSSYPAGQHGANKGMATQVTSDSATLRRDA